MRALSRVLLPLLGLALLVSPAMAADPPMLVTVEWLSRQLARPDLRIVDMSTERESYRTGHVPGAVYLNIDDVRIAVPVGGYRLPSAEEATRLLAALCIGPDTSVVIYDDAGGLHASRFFFTPRGIRPRARGDRGRRPAALAGGGAPRGAARREGPDGARLRPASAD